MCVIKKNLQLYYIENKVSHLIKLYMNFIILVRYQVINFTG